MRLARELGGRTAWLWMEQRLDGEPATFAGPADSTLNRVLTPLVELAERASTVRPPDPAPRIDLQAPPARCVAAPFRIVSGTPIP
jgi:hypothetical protein